MSLVHYRLRGHEVEPVYSFNDWARWVAKADRRVALTLVLAGVRSDPEEAIQISTVFLGIDHSFSDAGPPVLFETMVFGAPEMTELFGRIREMRLELNLEGGFARYSTWAEAEAGHAKIVKVVRDAVAHTEQVVTKALSKLTTPSREEP